MLVVSGPVGAEDTRLEVLTVHNRPAEDLVATLGPLAGPEGALTSLDNRLIVRATPGALAQIRAALEQLDVAPRTLWITVRQATAASSAARAGQISGTVSGNIGSVLGEWLHIGGIASQQSEQAAALLSGGSRAGTSDWNVDLKVEADPTP